MMFGAPLRGQVVPSRAAGGLRWAPILELSGSAPAPKAAKRASPTWT